MPPPDRTRRERLAYWSGAFIAPSTSSSGSRLPGPGAGSRSLSPSTWTCLVVRSRGSNGFVSQNAHHRPVE